MNNIEEKLLKSLNSLELRTLELKKDLNELLQYVYDYYVLHDSLLSLEDDFNSYLKLYISHSLNESYDFSMFAMKNILELHYHDYLDEMSLAINININVLLAIEFIENKLIENYNIQLKNIKKRKEEEINNILNKYKIMNKNK